MSKILHCTLSLVLLMSYRYINFSALSTH
jgi:hypothetical protein